MAGEFWLDDRQWAVIGPLLPTTAGAFVGSSMSCDPAADGKIVQPETGSTWHDKLMLNFAATCYTQLASFGGLCSVWSLKQRIGNRFSLLGPMQYLCTIKMRVPHP